MSRAYDNGRPPDAKAAAHGGPVTEVDAGSFNARGVAVAGQDVDGLHAGQTVAVDADVAAFPQSFSSLPPGRRTRCSLASITRATSGKASMTASTERIFLRSLRGRS